MTSWLGTGKSINFFYSVLSASSATVLSFLPEQQMSWSTTVWSDGLTAASDLHSAPEKQIFRSAGLVTKNHLPFNESHLLQYQRNIILLSVYTDIDVLCIFGRRTCMFGQLLLPSLEEFATVFIPRKVATHAQVQRLSWIGCRPLLASGFVSNWKRQKRRPEGGEGLTISSVPCESVFCVIFSENYNDER